MREKGSKKMVPMREREESSVRERRVEREKLEKLNKMWKVGIKYNYLVMLQDHPTFRWHSSTIANFIAISRFCKTGWWAIFVPLY